MEIIDNDDEILSGMPIGYDTNPGVPRSFTARGIAFYMHEDDPAFLLEVLRQKDGDIMAYAASFSSIGTAHQQRLISKTYAILNKPGNETHKKEWKILVDSYQEAKIAMAEHKACEFVSHYHLPKGGRGMSIEKRPPVSTYLSVLKHVGASKAAFETTKAKKEGTLDARTPPSAPVQDSLKGYLESMKQEVE